MASNRELKDRAGTLGKMLGLEVRTAGLGNAELEQLVADLEAKQAEAPPVSAAAPPDEPSSAPVAAAAARAPAPPQAPAPARVTFVVAPRKAIVCDGRVLSEGQEIRPKDLPGGIDRIRALMRAGLVKQG